MIYKKIVDIMNEIIPLGKIKREEIVPMLLPLLAKHKIAIKPAEVSDYKYSNQEASFLAKYELVDTEDNLESMIIQLPGGGCDSENKGRATYMASTGIYRQMLQQVFAIPIEEDNGVNTSQTRTEENSERNVYEFDEFANENEETQEQKDIAEFTDDDIDAEFAGF